MVTNNFISFGFGIRSGLLYEFMLTLNLECLKFMWTLKKTVSINDEHFISTNIIY